MTCGDKFNKNCPTGGTSVTPAETDGRPLCNHPGCGKRLRGDGTCVDGHVQGAQLQEERVAGWELPADFDRGRFLREGPGEPRVAGHRFNPKEDVPHCIRTRPDLFSDQEVWEFGYRPHQTMYEVAPGAWLDVFYSAFRLARLYVLELAPDSHYVRSGRFRVYDRAEVVVGGGNVTGLSPEEHQRIVDDLETEDHRHLRLWRDEVSALRNVWEKKR